jgi:hypothetical protein
VANSINGFLERLTAAAGDYNKAKVGTLGYLDSVFKDVRPEVARMGQTIRIYFPDVGAFTDQAANDWSPEDLNPGYVDVPFGQRPGKAILVRDFEQFQTSTDIIEQFIDPNYKRASEFANGQIANLLTSANFNAYTPLAGSKAKVAIGDAQLAWNLLVKNKVPVRDPGNSALLLHPDVHANMLTDSTWYQESLVGAMIASGTRQNAAEPGTASNVAFNFTRLYDQQAPTSVTANLSGTVTNTSASTAIVGSSSKFLTEAPVGSWIFFGAETVSYPVVAVADDTHLTLGQAYVGTGGSGVTVTRTTYTSVAMHKYAIALAVRPLEIVNDGHIRSRLIMLQGLPMRLMLSYQHLKSGWLMSLDYGMVAKVIRPDFGILIQN